MRVERPLELDDEYGAFEAQLARRRGTLIAAMLALSLTFGTAHMFARAWAHGFVLAAAELVGFVLVFAGSGTDLAALGGALILGCIVLDAVGGVCRVRAGPPPPGLPIARIHR